MDDPKPGGIGGTPDAGNGLFGRRAILRGGLAGATAWWASSAAAVPARPDWMGQPGIGMSAASGPSPEAGSLQRVGLAAQPGTDGSGASRTPLQHLDGMITPSRLHFERHHSGIPQIDPRRHELFIHGLVERPLAFDLDALMRYPMVSRVQFLECSGNSGALLAPQPLELDCAGLHGLLSVSEWGGVPLSVLLDEAGVQPAGKWVVAEGADAAVMSRSVPLQKMLDDAIVAVYQNGEPLRPANGFPMRLFLPGWEGNASVKWLRALKVTNQPAMSKDETSKYSDLAADGSARLFSFPMDVKSVITSPSPGLRLNGAGWHQIRGLAWSGAGRISRVDVSVDAGRSWAEALLDEHVLPQCTTRFRAAWRWDGAPATLLSRAVDETGAVQPTRESVIQGRSSAAIYHMNPMQAWAIDAQGEARNVYV